MAAQTLSECPSRTSGKTFPRPAHVAGIFFDRADLQGMPPLPSNATRVGTAVARSISPDHDAAFIGTA